MNTKYRILMISPQFKPIIGGYERSAERLSVELAKIGHSVTVLAERRNMAWPSREVFDGITLRRFWCLFKPGLHLATSLVSMATFLLCNAWRYQIYHVHQYGHHAAISIILGKILHHPVILKLTSTNQGGLSNRLKENPKLIQRVLIFLHKKVDACITTSSDAYNEALAFGIPAERIYLIGNGVNALEFSPCSDHEKLAKKKHLGIESELLILYVGRISDEKNPLGLLSAWASIKDEFRNARLVFVGDGPQFKLLRQKIEELDCVESVRLAGKTADVLSWYQIADMYVLPSKHEGLANTLLEAMSCELPIVSTRVSGSTDIFQRADIGELVNVGDTDELASGIRKLLLDNTRRKQCGSAAREIIRESYSLESIARETSNTYDTLLRTRKSS